MKRYTATVILLLLFIASATADDYVVRGSATVIDGDTLRLGRTSVRLHGIDAPETRQQCLNVLSQIYDCGRLATQALRELTAGRIVTCRGSHKDRYGRLIAKCETPEAGDLNALLVRRGHALAYRRFSNDYAGDENGARQNRQGLWQGRFVAPWQWRQGKRLP